MELNWTGLDWIELNWVELNFFWIGHSPQLAQFLKQNNPQFSRGNRLGAPFSGEKCSAASSIRARNFHSAFWAPSDEGPVNLSPEKRISGSKASKLRKAKFALEMNKNARRLLRKKKPKSPTGIGHQNLTLGFRQKPLPPFQAQKLRLKHRKIILFRCKILMSQLQPLPLSRFERGEGFFV